MLGPEPIDLPRMDMLSEAMLSTLVKKSNTRIASLQIYSSFGTPSYSP